MVEVTILGFLGVVGHEAVHECVCGWLDEHASEWAVEKVAKIEESVRYSLSLNDKTYGLAAIWSSNRCERKSVRSCRVTSPEGVIFISKFHWSMLTLKLFPDWYRSNRVGDASDSYLLCEPLRPLPRRARGPPIPGPGVPPMDQEVPSPSIEAPRTARKEASRGPMPTTSIVTSMNWVIVA